MQFLCLQMSPHFCKNYFYYYFYYSLVFCIFFYRLNFLLFSLFPILRPVLFGAPLSLFLISRRGLLPADDPVLWPVDPPPPSPPSSLHLPRH